jgi:hypothetical protein
MQAQTRRQSALVSALAVVALLSMTAAYFQPVWWVSLTAPNYPQDAFPDGIRIQFGFDGVHNGCTSAAATSRVAQETQQEDLGWRTEGGAEPKTEGRPKEASLDCVHEMNTINHYVGMHPIGFGAPVERVLSKFILAMFAVMLAAFALGSAKARVVVLAVGFVAVTGWMLVDLFALGSLATFVTVFMDDAGRYFREAERMAAWGVTLQRVVLGAVAFLVAVMAFTTWASARWTRFQLVLGIVPALLPGFFVAAFAAWLYYFGHSLHPWGAFTVKPFMPTVFGDGKVAQFTTHSYPHLGFALLGLVTLALTIAVARRRVELLDEPAAPTAP